MRKLILLSMVALLALTFGPASNALAHVAAQGKVVRLTLIDENGSGEDGSAQLTDLGDGTTKVELIMLNAPEGAEQPAHIHKGTCTTLDPKPAYPLETVKEGKSTTIVKVTLADLTKEKYAINVHKSAAEASIYVSCGNLPSAIAAAGGPTTLDQAFTLMLDQATEILGNVQKKEADASKNAYDAYHATFAANEDAIKAKDAASQTKLEDAMHGVRDAINEGNYDEAAEAAQELINEVKAAQTKVGTSSSPDTGLEGAMQKLQSTAADLVRETTNKDKEGSQRAYDDFHEAFAANEAAIMAKDAATQAELETRMHEVRDAIAKGDLADAAQASKELQEAVQAADTKLMGGQGGTSDLPTLGAGDMVSPVSLVLVLFSLALVLSGFAVRRRAAR